MLYKVYYKDISTKERRKESKRLPKTPDMQNRKRKRKKKKKKKRRAKSYGIPRRILSYTLVGYLRRF